MTYVAHIRFPLGQHWFRPFTSLPTLKSCNLFISCDDNHRERRPATGLTILHTLVGFFTNSGPNCSLARTFLRVMFAARNLEKWGNVSPRQRAGLFPFTVKARAFPAQRSPPVTWTTARAGGHRGHLCCREDRGASGNETLSDHLCRDYGSRVSDPEVCLLSASRKL